MHHHLFITLILLFFAGANANADEWDMSSLMHLLAKNKPGEATFVEKKYIAMLNQPIESSGELAFSAPDKLVKRTLTPIHESLTLEGDQLTIERPGTPTLTIRLQEHPEISTIVESIRYTLTGDHAALDNLYSTQLTGTDKAWQLVLVPRQARVSAVISRIRIAGTHADVTRIDFEQPDGDHSEMIITQSPNP